MSIALPTAALPPRPSFKFLLTPQQSQQQQSQPMVYHHHCSGSGSGGLGNPNKQAHDADPNNNNECAALGADERLSDVPAMVVKPTAYVCMCLALHAHGGAAEAALPVALLYYDQMLTDAFIAATNAAAGGHHRSHHHNVISASITTDVVAGTLVMLLHGGSGNGSWAACAAWVGLLGATHVVDCCPVPRLAAHAAAALLALTMLTTTAAVVVKRDNDDEPYYYYYYVLYLARAGVYMALSLVDYYFRGRSQPHETDRIAMLRYGAVLFASSALMLAASAAALSAAVTVRFFVQPGCHHRLARAAAKRGPYSCVAASLLALCGSADAEAAAAPSAALLLCQQQPSGGGAAIAAAALLVDDSHIIGGQYDPFDESSAEPPVSNKAL